MSGDAVEVVVPEADVDLASGLLWGAGVAAIAEVPVGDGRVRLRADVPEGGVDAVWDALGGRWPVAVVEVGDDGLDAWREHAGVVAVGRRLVVRPPWVPLGPVADDAVVLEVDPGRAFGHGAHPTTRLCLAAVEDLVGAGARSVLDVGCGSGVLAVAAAALGAAPVVAVDVDPAAVAATTENAARNRVRVEARRTESAPGAVAAAAPGPVDLVVANLGEASLRGLLPELADLVAPGGVLVLSGLLDPPPDDVVHAPSLRRWDRATEALDGWVAVTLRRRDDRREVPSSP